MKRSRVIARPCVVLPANPFTGRREEHVLHATAGRAKRNAVLSSGITGAYYHVHEDVVPTLFGRVLRLIGRAEK